MRRDKRKPSQTMQTPILAADVRIVSVDSQFFGRLENHPSFDSLSVHSPVLLSIAKKAHGWYPSLCHCVNNASWSGVQ